MQMQNETHFFFFSGKVPASPYVYYSQPSQRSNDDPEKSYFPIS